ncbi:TM2 domain-containing protein [bacterium]|nr:TM2 domain-containing protein [bacterium]
MPESQAEPPPVDVPPPPPVDTPPPPAPPVAGGTPPAYDPQKKILVGVLAIVVGMFGVHKFLLDYQKEGFIMLGVTIGGILTSCFLFGLPMFAMGIIGLVEGIIYLTKSDEEFYEMYIKNQKTWF